ncbi:MAG: recombinase family protein, partial [Clostridium sp.]
MKVGYVRVSTIDQNESRQMKRMKEMGIEKIYLEKSSAKDIEGRPELKNLLEFVREGDTIYVHD